VVVTSKNREQVSISMLQLCRILVATSCAGTGLNIGSFEQIAVVGLPYSVEQLLQWAGRLRESGEISVFTCSSHHWKKTELSGKSDVPGFSHTKCVLK